MNRTDIFNIMMQHIQEVLGDLPRNVSESDRLVDLGANSIDRIEIMSLCLESLRLEIPRIDLKATDTIGGMLDIIHGHYAR